MKHIPLYNSDKLSIFSVLPKVEMELPFMGTVSAGFPSPAADFLDIAIDLNQYLIKNPSSTFIVRTTGNSMVGAGISDGDILIVDKSLQPENNKIAICVLDNDFTVKRLKVTKQGIWLMPENPTFSPKKITEFEDFEIWGIVTYSIKQHG